jgi:hypothetical protein
METGIVLYNSSSSSYSLKENQSIVFDLNERVCEYVYNRFYANMNRSIKCMLSSFSS